jgi:hypothetical protein
MAILAEPFARRRRPNPGPPMPINLKGRSNLSRDH